MKLPQLAQWKCLNLHNETFKLLIFNNVIPTIFPKNSYI